MNLKVASTVSTTVMRCSVRKLTAIYGPNSSAQTAHAFLWRGNVIQV